MDPRSRDRGWFWVTFALSCLSILVFVFAIWELIEHHFLRFADYLTLHYLYITRGIVSSLLLAGWAAWYVLRHRRRSEEALRQSRERYRSLLESAPGAVALYDGSLRIIEWNTAAEQLYGFSKAEVHGQELPTIPAGKRDEMCAFLGQVLDGRQILDVETTRCNKEGAILDVQLSLLPFRDSDGRNCVLDVTSDIRERVRMRQKILHIEKLTIMGKMAAGTAHHLNTPLAAMLLRVQMMQRRMHGDACQADLERLENGIRGCQQFVSRLLEFGRRAPASRQSEDVAHTLQSVLSFLSPAFQAKNASISLDIGKMNGQRVLADRHQLEAVFSALLSNALDAISPGGKIDVGCSPTADGWLDIWIQDSGCGISATARPRIFEPFFTTKGAGKGTGLGLAITHNIVVEHGGSIRLESEPGRGTTVRVQLPLQAPIS